MAEKGVEEQVLAMERLQNILQKGKTELKSSACKFTYYVHIQSSTLSEYMLHMIFPLSALRCN